MAARAKGVVSRRELLAADISEEEVQVRIETGALLPEHRGTYRVGHRAPSAEATYIAAVRACGPGARRRGCGG